MSNPKDPKGEPPKTPPGTPSQISPTGGYYAAHQQYGVPAAPYQQKPGSSGYYPPAGAPPAAYPTPQYQTPQPMYQQMYGGQPQPYAGAQAYAVQTPPGGISQGTNTMAERPAMPTGGGVSQSGSTMAEGMAPAGGPGNVHALIGRKIDRYQINKLLGEGGFGAVYKAEHMLMKRDVAFKTLHKELAKDPAVLHRFKKEGQVASRFRHKNAIELYDFGQMDDGTYFMAMEFLPGRDLRDHLKKKGALELGETFDIMIQSLSALHAAHEGGVIHRDLKPDNIKLENREDRENFVKILDFGIAKIKDAEAHLDKPSGTMTSDEAQRLIEEAKRLGPVSDEPPENSSSYKTQVGAFFGTPEYGSPEQCAGEEIDARSDLYTMGVILYECLTGSLPFVSKTPQGYLAQHMVAPPRPINDVRPDLKIPPEVEHLILKALEKKREDRFQSANEFAEAMIDVAHKCGIPITVEAGGMVVVKTPTWKILLAIALPIALVVGGALYYIRTQGKAELKTAIGAVGEKTANGDYEGALDWMADQMAPIVRDEQDPVWVAEQEVAIQEKIKARDERLAAFFAEIEQEHDARPPLERKYAATIEKLKNAIETDFEVKARGEVRKRFTDKVSQVEKDLSDDAWAAWDMKKKEIEALREAGELEAAKAKCVDLPNHYFAVVSKQAQILQDEISEQISRTDKTTKIAADALARAHEFRAQNPDNWAGQIEQYDEVVKKYPGTRAAARIKAEYIPRAREEREAAGAKALKPVVDASDAALASPSPESLAAAFKTHALFPEKFRTETQAGRTWSSIENSLINRANDTMDQVLAATEDFRRHKLNPEQALKLVEPWTKFETRRDVKERADKAFRSLEKALKLHENMVLCKTAEVEIGEKNAALGWGPLHKRTVKGFMIDKTEVTNAQWLAFLQDEFGDDPARFGERVPDWWNGQTYPPLTADHPVRQVSLIEAKQFASWAGKRLPDEFEWEYAARGAEAFESGNFKAFPWGFKRPSEGPEAAQFCRYKTKDEKIPTAVVGTHLKGDSQPFQLHDMAGNVTEWTTSPYLRYDGTTARDAFAPDKFVCRGGSFAGKTVLELRCVVRYAHREDAKNPEIGFRCVKPVE